MASLAEPQAWQEELQSYLPHALNCVDPDCLHPLCVNLKLILRHIPNCEKTGKCTICLGMKSLAANHSESFRDYYCRIPFCWEAKVASEEQKLIDELVATSPADTSLHGLKENQLGTKKAEDNGTAVDMSRKTMDDSCQTPRLAERNGPSLSGDHRKDSEEGSSGKVQPSCFDATTVQLSSVSIGKTFPPEWTGECGPLTITEDASKSLKPSSQRPTQRHLPNCEDRKSIDSSKTGKSSPISLCQPGTKRKLQRFIYTNKESVSALKDRRPVPTEKIAKIDHSREVIEIVDSKLSGASMSSVSPKHKYDLPIPTCRLSSSIKTRSARKGSSPKSRITSNFTEQARKAASWDGGSDLPGAGFQEPSQNPSVTVDSDDLFLTPPPSPTFETWFGEPASTNEGLLKSVLLDTLFQLLRIVTQPKTKQQEAIFVDLLESTLRAMKIQLQNSVKDSERCRV